MVVAFGQRHISCTPSLSSARESGLHYLMLWQIRTHDFRAWDVSNANWPTTWTDVIHCLIAESTVNNPTAGAYGIWTETKRPSYQLPIRCINSGVFESLRRRPEATEKARKRQKTVAPSKELSIHRPLLIVLASSVLHTINSIIFCWEKHLPEDMNLCWIACISKLKCLFRLLRIWKEFESSFVKMGLPFAGVWGV
ncbi:hypothetical protein ACLOJK_032546 [Asimina triloba]